MFMRFFEEIEILIDTKRMNADIAYDMFSYYLLEFAEKKDLFDIKDYNEDCWRRFRRIVERMTKIRKNKVSL